jgi:hypothetical protein
MEAARLAEATSRIQDTYDGIPESVYEPPIHPMHDCLEDDTFYASASR